MHVASLQGQHASWHNSHQEFRCNSAWPIAVCRQVRSHSPVSEDTLLHPQRAIYKSCFEFEKQMGLLLQNSTWFSPHSGRAEITALKGKDKAGPHCCPRIQSKDCPGEKPLIQLSSFVAGEDETSQQRWSFNSIQLETCLKGAVGLSTALQMPWQG